MEESTRTLVVSGKGLEALERLIAHFPPEFLDSICGSSVYSYTDPTREAAVKALYAWYSVDFLEEAMKNGSDDAAYWALRKLHHQAINGPHKGEENDSTRRLVACGGVVTLDVRTRLIPILEKLRTAKSDRTRNESINFAKGLLLDRDVFLKSLQEKDEKLLNASLMQMLDRVRFDPHLTQEIWSILTRAQTDSLKGTCLRYPWLFELPEWSPARTAMFAQYLKPSNNASNTNAKFSLGNLARSDNPLAGQVFAALAAIDDKEVKEELAELQSLYRKRHKPTN